MIKKIAGLLADLENIKGEFNVPKEFARLDTVGRLHILTDWKAGIECAIDKAHADCFADLLQPNYDPNVDFELIYNTYVYAIDGFGVEEPSAAVKGLCKIESDKLLSEHMKQKNS